jgi:hypothetical protein
VKIIKIEIKTENIGTEGMQMIRCFANGKEVMSLSDGIYDFKNNSHKWYVGMSSCLSDDIETAKKEIECMNKAFEKLEELKSNK